MSEPVLSIETEQEIPTAAESVDSEQTAVEAETPAAPVKVKGYLVPNRHDRRRAAAKARRKPRGK